jgi:tRNA (guanine37-N1)-methyltransferase
VTESFRGDLLEEPHYTRPASFRGWEVPEVLLSGDHGKVEAWRRNQRRERTNLRRPELTEGDSGPEPNV